MTKPVAAALAAVVAAVSAPDAAYVHEIEAWRREQSEARTKERRPDLAKKKNKTKP